MEWLWIIQLGINLLFGIALFVWWKEKLSTPAIVDAVTVENKDLSLYWEKELFQLKKKSEERLRALATLCEQAQSILSRHAAEGSMLYASQEEQELKALRKEPLPKTPSESIPSVKELEVRKQSVRPQIPLDLRSLLRDQLS